MSLSIIQEVWDIVISNVYADDEITAAADALVFHMIDNDHSPTEIKAVFKKDVVIQRALEFYATKPGDEFVKYDETEELEEEYDDLDYNSEHTDDY